MPCTLKYAFMYLAMDTKDADAPPPRKKRTYEMRARKEATEATHEAIVQAAIDAVIAERSLAINLKEIAERAGVTVKTVLRHFGSREPLVAAAWARVHHDVLIERTAPPEDPDQALALLVDHYEHRGDVVLGLLAEEDDEHPARVMCDTGRAEHRSWVKEIYGPRLPVAPAQRSRVIDALVVATDIYSWKLLRRDQRLSVDQVIDRMQLMIDSILTSRASSSG